METNITPNVKVGDIFVNSWGYDQTNIDAYQVTRLTPKMMVLQQISTTPVTGTAGFMCQHCKPAPDSFVHNAKPFKARIPSGDGFGLNYGYARKWDGVKTYYESWYA
jgi:hypothetical protein